MTRVRVRAFAVSTVVLMVLVAFQAAVQNRPTDPPKTADPPIGPLGPSSNPYLPSSQTLVNGTQTQGNCGSTWTNIQNSDNAYCSYREVNTAPASPTKLLPNANGDTVSWTTVGCTEANEYQCVDDDPNNGDTDYIKSTSTSVTDSLENLGTVAFNGATVSSVTANIWCRKTVSQTVAVRALIKTNGNLYTSDSNFNCPNSGTYGTTSKTWAVNPQTGALWTQVEIEALQAGCRDNDGTNRQVRCSEVRVDVNFHARYALEVRFAWSGVPLTGDRWTLAAECKYLVESPSSGETLLIQVGQGGNPPSSWKTAYTCASGTDTAFNSYFLSAAELNSGAPLVRLWDNQGPADTAQGTTDIDVLRIDRTEYRTGFLPWDYYVEKMVNADNGNLHLAFRDLSVKALGWDLSIERAYNAFLASSETLMGRGWTFAYDTRLVEEAPGIVQWWDPDGSVHTFRLSGSTYVAPAGIDARLTKPSAYKLWFKDGSTFDFNGTTNRLATITDRNGNTVTLTWTALAPLRLTTVADSSGLQLNFTYQISGPIARLTQVQDPIGRTVKYAYDANGDLRTYTDAMGNNTFYVYDGSHRILTWQEPGSQTQVPAPQVRRVTFAYDLSDRVTSIKYASVNAQTNASQYEYVAWGLAYVAASFGGADHALNATNGRSVVTTINVDAVGSPLNIKGPPCGECASLVQSPNAGSPGCGCAGGCGSNSVEATEELTLTWSSNRDLLTRKDKGNHQYNYTYDAKRNLLNTTDPLGNVTRNVWTNADNATAYLSTLNKTTNARLFTWFYEYDAKGNLKQVKDPTNNVSKYAYTAKGYVSKYTDWRGFNTTFDYDSHGYLLNETDATNNKTTFQNDGVGRVTRVTHPDTDFSRTEYDKNDRVTRTIDELNNATSLEYNARNDPLTRRDPLGRITTYEWNTTNHLMSRVIDALGNSTTIGYDLIGNIVKLTSPRGFNTTLTYDNFNRRTVAKDALNNETQYTYDGDGLVISIRDRRGFRTNYTYDANHRTKTVKDALGNTTRYDYDQVSNMVKTKNGRGFETSYVYDALNRVTRVTDALGNFTQVGYDANGNTLSVRGPDTNTQTMTYDALNRLKTATNPLGFVTTYTYDSENNPLQVKDAENRLTAYTYDPLHRRTQIKDALNDTTNFTYDAVGNLLNITDDNGRVTRGVYDGLDRLTSETSPLGKVTRFTYDANGNVAARKDALLRTTTYTYDALDRLTKTAYPTTNLTFTYDAEGNRLAATGFGFTRTDVFDALNRVTSTTFNYGSFSKQVQYTYDQVGSRKTMRYPEGQYVNSTYDALDRLTTLSDSSVGSWSFVYDAASRRTRITHPSGLKTEYAYNKANWVFGVYTNTSGGSVVESFTYTYDKMGNRKTMVENGGNTSTYGYDATYRLRNESYTGGLVINYTYDGVGNRLTDVRNGVTTSYTYDADNRLTAQGTTTFGYDDNGNQIRKTVGGQNTTYDWDIENRLTKVTFPNATNVQYEYSTDGNRMSRIQGGTKAWYAYDFRDRNGFDDVVAEYDAMGALVARYVHGPGIDEPLVMTRGGTYFYSFDALGSATQLTTIAQATNARYRYEAFGAARGWQEGVTNPYRFTTREWDGTPGLYFYRARWFSQTTGLFLSKDPISQQDGQNLYTYAGNNPMNSVDPSGMSHRRCGWWDVWCKIQEGLDHVKCGLCIGLLVLGGLTTAILGIYLMPTLIIMMLKLCPPFIALCGPLGWLCASICVVFIFAAILFVIGAGLYAAFTAPSICKGIRACP